MLLGNAVDSPPTVGVEGGEPQVTILAGLSELLVGREGEVSSYPYYCISLTSVTVIFGSGHLNGATTWGPLLRGELTRVDTWYALIRPEG